MLFLNLPGNSQHKWTAGVYLLMRSSPLIEYSSTVLVLCLWLGAITTVFSSLIGLFQQDIKKVIAYSTMSQLARQHNILIMFTNQTIYVEARLNLVNSQITKALKYYVNNNIYISNNFLNSFINIYWLLLLNKAEKWKIIIVRKLVGISEAIRLMLIYILFISFNTVKLLKNYSTLFTTSEIDQSFNEWLAGLIDGDGHFLLSKSGSARLYIVMDIRDKGALYEILHKFGGSIRPIAGAKALRYNLSNKKGLVKLIEAVNGQIRNPTRLLQLNKLCNKYNISLKYPNPLTFYNGWFSGFLDSDGSIYFSESSGQVFLSATQKNIYLLEPLINIYGGRVDPSNDRGEAFKYIIYRKKEIFNMIDNYFNKYPLRTLKSKRLHLIKEFYVVRTYKDTNDILKLNEWVAFKDKWEKYKN
uniref:NADH dehydrogenase subunit 5 n=1 Tax=Aspergillus sclerotioniger TaxID=319627 RepID=UPI00211483D4|nr:NADH dehydrogenase subunit 5 [Aspergillus sclerotioniger]USH57643.1 NADH dehydrogenase subunit 5 [Aspergillus sclerotioniger]